MWFTDGSGIFGLQNSGVCGLHDTVVYVVIVHSGVCSLKITVVYVVNSIQWCLWLTVYCGVCGLQYTVVCVVSST